MSDPPQSTGSAEPREATDDDAAAVLRLIGGCFAEYEGCVLDPEGIDAWMVAPASSYVAKGGQFWVLDEGADEPAAGGNPSGDTAATADRHAGDLAACIGWAKDGAGRIELKNLYVSARARRQGLGRRLVGMVEAAAREQGASSVFLWSDTRFEDAHRLYEELGYQRTGQQRALHDPSNSIEYGFVKSLGTGPVSG